MLGKKSIRPLQKKNASSLNPIETTHINSVHLQCSILNAASWSLALNHMSRNIKWQPVGGNGVWALCVCEQPCLPVWPLTLLGGLNFSTKLDKATNMHFPGTTATTQNMQKSRTRISISIETMMVHAKTAKTLEQKLNHAYPCWPTRPASNWNNSDSSTYAPRCTTVRRPSSQERLKSRFGVQEWFSRPWHVFHCVSGRFPRLAMMGFTMKCCQDCGILWGAASCYCKVL